MNRIIFQISMQSPQIHMIVKRLIRYSKSNNDHLLTNQICQGKWKLVVTISLLVVSYSTLAIVVFCFLPLSLRIRKILMNWMTKKCLGKYSFLKSELYFILSSSIVFFSHMNSKSFFFSRLFFLTTSFYSHQDNIEKEKEESKKLVFLLSFKVYDNFYRV